MKKYILGALLLLCSAVMLKAQDASPQSDVSGVVSAWMTARTFNGRFWKQLSPEEKRVFLFGYSTGVEQVSVLAGEGSFERYKKISKLFWARALTVDEVRSALNGFYETPENSPIAIPNAINVISKRSEGASEAEIQKQVAALRAQATK